MYSEFEIKSLLEYQDEKYSPLYCLTLLKKIYESFQPSNLCLEKETCPSEENNQKFLPKLKISKIILEHPIILKLFLETNITTEVPKFITKQINKCVKEATKMVLNIAQLIFNLEAKSFYSYLELYKSKVLQIVSKLTGEKGYDDINLLNVMGTLSVLFSSKEISVLLENLLDLGHALFHQSESFLSLLVLLFKQYFENDEKAVLSANCINALILKYGAMSRKQKKLFKYNLLQLFLKHPSYAMSVDKDSFWLLLQHRSDKDFTILCALIEHSIELRQLTQNYLSENIEDSMSLDIFCLASNCISMANLDDELDKNFLNSIAMPFWEALKLFLIEEHKNEAEFSGDCQVVKAALLLLKEKIISPKKLSKFCNLLLQNSGTDAPSPPKMTVLLQLLEVWKNQRTEQEKDVLPVLKIIFKWITCALSKDFEHKDLNSYIKKTLQDLEKIDINEVLEVNVFFQKALKVSMAYEDVGKIIMEVLILLCEKSKGVNLPVQGIFNLAVGHSNFFQIMLERKGDKKLKEKIIELLTILTKLDSTICKEQHITLFLGAYGGTLSSIDQKLLYLIKIYSDNDVNMAKYTPFLWGQAAITHYSIMSNGMQHSLRKRAKLRDIVSLLSPDKMETTVLHYPLKISLQPSLEHLEEIDEKLADNIYDLRFFLPLLANLLSPGSLLNFNCFIESRLLMLIFTSLSSLDSNVRSMGYYCLSQLYYHLEGSYAKEKEIWLSLLDSVRNSITSSNSKLPCIITLFLARVTDIFTKPSNPMYIVLYKYIMVKPCLDVTQVPNFYSLFNSLDLEFRIQRLWLLKLLGEGIRTSLDFHICEKRYIFSIIQSLFWSSVSTQQEKAAILNIILSAVKIESSAKTLCQSGLLVWLHYILKECDVDNELAAIVNAIITHLGNMNIDNSSLQFLESLKKNIFDNSPNGQPLSTEMDVDM